MFAQTLVKHSEKHTGSIKLPGSFFPILTSVLREVCFFFMVFFYIQMLWIAPGKGRPFSQQEELILFDCSLWSLKVFENLTTARTVCELVYFRAPVSCLCICTNPEFQSV